jgi:hypothetical protein
VPHEPASTRPPLRHGRGFVLGVVAISLSVTSALLLFEIVLNVIDYPPRHTDHQQLFIEYDPARGWRNTPNANGEYITEEYRVHLTYNSRGIRGPERPYEKSPGTFRVVVIGDSFVEGYMVPLRDRVTEVLEALLKARGPRRPVEVIALGTAGYSTDQELLWLESEGLRYQPDVVVAMFYANDVWYNAQPAYWRGSKPLFVFRDEALTLTNVPVPRTAEGSDESTLRDWIEHYSKIFWIVGGAVKNIPVLYRLSLRAGIAEIPPEMVLEVGDAVPVPAEFNVYRSTGTAETELAWRTTQALFGRMRRTTEGAGAQFLAFLVPLRGDIYTHEEVVRARDSASAEGWNPRAVAERFHQICTAEGLTCIDPTEQFRTAAQRDTAQRLYYRFDWHWNATGHALAARILADHIGPWAEIR